MRLEKEIKEFCYFTFCEPCGHDDLSDISATD